MRRASMVPLFCLVLSTPALAWDPDLHVAIFEAARQISPVLDSRLDETTMAEVLAGIREADPADKACQRHRGIPGRPEAWTLAEAALKNVRTPHPKWGPRQKARALGAYLHFVADCAAPAIAIRDQIQTMPWDLAVYREKGPVGDPVAESLARRAAAVSGRGGGHEVLPAAFRDAVNLTIDAALLAPLPAGAKEPEDVGPVLMIPMVYITESIRGERVESLRILHSGLHVLEWSIRRTPTADLVSALVQNNMDFCVRHVFFRNGRWVGGLTTSIPPNALTLVEFPGPPGASLDVVPRFVPGDCAEGPAGRHVSTRWLKVAVPDGSEMRFDRVREFRPGEKGPELVGTAVFVEYLEGDLAAMKGLEIPAFQAVAGNDRVDFDFRLRNRADRSGKPLFIEFEISSSRERVTELVEIKVDLKGVAPGAERVIKGSVPVKTHGEFTELRIFRIRREAAATTRRKEVTW